ncbi:MAG: HTH domain-containing protein, partial [Bryobacteraceae bacterium]|nr:HTH domain-containing protein [Bryobacteraceae bacterium]
MSQMERIYVIHRMLERGRAVPLSRIIEKLEISRATAKRDIEFMRYRLDAPIQYDRELGGYRYAPAAEGDGQPQEYQLPGIWLTSSEMSALLLMRHLLEHLNSDVLSEALGPAVERIEAMAGVGERTLRDLRRRFRVLAARHRPVNDQIFRIVSTAVTQRKKLRLTYFSRSRGEILTRDVSPQRLI